MALQNKDFIEIEFTAKIKDGELFDSNRKADLEKAGMQGNPKPMILSLGQGMFLKGAEDFLIGKDIGKHTIELTPENAFGKRDPKLIRMVPLKEFKHQQVMPVQGQVFNFDGKLAKVLTVSGGRVMVDFNNPLSGKDVVYDIEVFKKVEDLNVKIEALIDFFFRKPFEFKVEGKNLNLKVEKGFLQFANLFAEKFKEILDLDLKVEEEEKKEEEKVEEEETPKGVPSKDEAEGKKAEEKMEGEKKETKVVEKIEEGSEEEEIMGLEKKEVFEKKEEKNDSKTE